MINNTIIKNVRRAAMVAALAPAIALTSCVKDTLDLEPAYSLSENSGFDTPEHVELAVAGAYDLCQQGHYSGSIARGYPFGAASIMQGEMRGEDFMMSQQFYLITFQGTYNASSLNNLTMWEASFEALNRVNIVMQGAKQAGADGVIDAATANQYEGEMLFLRAMIYHNLLIHFSAPYNLTGYNNDYGLPLYLTPNVTQDDIDAAMTIGRSTVAQTYSQILNDLNQAESLLPETNAANNITRANKWAAIAMKTRVYLHMRDWNNVVTEAKKFDSAPYALEADPATPFLSYTSNKESIFSIENAADDNATVNGSMSNMFNPYNRYMCPMSPILYNNPLWLEDDKRREELVEIFATDGVPYCYKYRSEGNDNDYQGEYAPMLRLPEVYLNYAEAALRNGDKDTALTYLNKVRDRSLADPASQSYKAADFDSATDMLNAILWEKRFETFGEGLRWGDIHRLAVDDMAPTGGIPAKIRYQNVMGEAAADVFVIGKEIDESWYLVGAYPYTDRRFLWPIPTNDLSRNATLAAQQNVGWSN